MASNTSAPNSGTEGAPSPLPLGPREIAIGREVQQLKERLVREATLAIGMLEAAIDALLRLDPEAARAVMRRDDEIDREEVHIEEEALRILALYQPFARDFRTVATLLRINADLERVGDHAHSIAKLATKMAPLGVPQWPTALKELTSRVPMLCHALLNTLLTENVESARSIFLKDRDIDSLDKRVFEESLDLMEDTRESKTRGMYMYRCGRELERVGDLMVNIAEDVVYLGTGSIVRHEEKKKMHASKAG
ncbi:MAG: phosphate signaling complex protein PhoU [Phycisphaerales bacterium]